MDATAAAEQFGDANREFAAMAHALDAGWASGAAATIPWVGRQYDAAQSLAAIGVDGSLAGVELAEALRSAPPATATAEATGQAGSQLSPKFAHVKSALDHLSSALSRADTLSADGLVGPLASAVRSVQDTLREVVPSGSRGRAMLELGTYLLSGNHRILVVSQDGAELRPTGGWAGSFGIVTVGTDGVQLESYRDVFVLPDPPGVVTPPPGALQTTDFNFRNANWWLDFPTSASKMLEFWNAYGQEPVDGIVVIDTVVMSDLLEIVGPITVPVHNETFTSENLLGLPHAGREGRSVGSQERPRGACRRTREASPGFRREGSGEVGDRAWQGRGCEARPDVLHRSGGPGCRRRARLVGPRRTAGGHDGHGRDLQRDEQARQGELRDEEVHRL